jgi:hypothetical protein
MLSDVIFRRTCSRDPVDSNPWPVKEGMTADEVVRAVGEPHRRYTEADGSERWIYFHDCLAYNYSGVRCDGQGRVMNTWIH